MCGKGGSGSRAASRQEMRGGRATAEGPSGSTEDRPRPAPVSITVSFKAHEFVHRVPSVTITGYLSDNFQIFRYLNQLNQQTTQTCTQSTDTDQMPAQGRTHL